MFLIDTHAHLYMDEFAEDRAAVLQKAFDAGVQRIYLPNVDESSIESLLGLEAAYPEHCFAMMGLHPCSVKEDAAAALDTIYNWLSRRSFSAIGEIGLDYHWDISFKTLQLAALRTQLDWAKEKRLPVVIHSRDATADCIRIIKEKQDGTLRGVFHCFSGTPEEARQIIDLGFYLGIGGVVTFKNAGLDKLVAEVDLAHLVLETDAPYLAPVPYRGKRNESSYLGLIADRVAAVKGLSGEEVATKTTANALQLFER